MNNLTIREGRREDAPIIAELIMSAMSDECCQWFAGAHHSLEDFRDMMTELIRLDNSQYSYTNCLVAETDRVVGVVCGYEGKRLHALRKAFIDAARERLGGDFANMTDETGEGEFYIDSLAVSPEARGMGIASLLLQTIIEKWVPLMPVGLLVDVDNPRAEALYKHLGFRYSDDKEWGGHCMKHMVNTR